MSRWRPRHERVGRTHHRGAGSAQAASDAGRGEHPQPAVEATEALADAANAITERDQTIHALRTRLAHAEAFSTVELQNCARYVNEGRDSHEAATRGQELARMVLYVGRSRDD